MKLISLFRISKNNITKGETQMKSILKKLCKAVLALSLAFTGVLYSTVNAKANEIVPYATPQSVTKTYTVGGTKSTNITLKLDFYIDATGMMTFTRARCTPVSGSCSIDDAYSLGYSQTGSQETMEVHVEYYKTETNGKKYLVYWRFDFRNNNLVSRNFVSETLKN